ncbi:hypothetical protein JW905_06225 [bacterium]|nr:hypothetical protein [candidate division CSSED10-310 bacterium]
MTRKEKSRIDVMRAATEVFKAAGGQAKMPETASMSASEMAGAMLYCFESMEEAMESVKLADEASMTAAEMMGTIADYYRLLADKMDRQELGTVPVKASEMMERMLGV